MLEKLSSKAIRIVMFAQEEARKLESAIVGTEHLILGILKDEFGIAAKILKERGLDYNPIKSQIAEVKPLKKYSSGVETYFSNHSKQIFELAEDEAARLGEEHVETEHILLGIVALGEGEAVKILESHGINLGRLKWNILRLRKEMESGKDYAQTPTLDKYSNDLTDILEKEFSSSVYERVYWIEKVLHGITCCKNPFVLLTGNSGVGKSSIVKGVTQYIIEGKVCSKFLNFRVVELDIPLFMAEVDSRKEIHAEMRNILNELAQAKDVILVIDDIDRLFLCHPDSKEYIIGEQLLPTLGSKNIFPFVATINLATYNSFKANPVYKYFSNIIYISEPTNEEMLHIAQFWKTKLEKYHGIQIDNNTMDETIKIAQSYKDERGLPDKVISFIDIAASKKRLDRSIAQIEIREIELNLRRLRQEREILANNKDLKGLEKIKILIKEKEEKIKKLNSTANPEGNIILTAQDIRDLYQ